MFIVNVGDQRDDGVNGYHEQDSDNVFLLPRFRVMAGMLEHEQAGDYGCNGGEYGDYGEAEVVEGPFSAKGFPNWCFGLHWRFC